jgi:hypothetical protein
MRTGGKFITPETTTVNIPARLREKHHNHGALLKVIKAVYILTKNAYEAV